MSEILQKTFNVLVGSGEGVGWGSPTSSNPHSLSGSLAATLRQLALAPLKEEKELCRVQIENCVSILSKPETSPSTTAECLVKGMFIQLMGQDASGLQIYAVKLAQASSLLHRKLGYLASSILIPNSSELLLLLTNCIMRDICSKSVPSILTGLIAACNLICDNSILSLLTDKVIQLVNYKNHLVRNKALITLDRFCYISPALWLEVEKIVVCRLSDEDPTVVSTALSLLSRHLKPDPEIGLVGLSPVLHVHQQIVENRLPTDFTYRGLVGPWMQVDILRIISKFNLVINTNSNIATTISDIVERYLDEEFSKELINQVLLAQAILLVSALDSTQHFSTRALKHVSRFLQSKQNHVKHTGLSLLETIFRRNPPELTEAQEANVLFCLEHPDPAIQNKTLDILILIANSDNLKKLVESVLNFLKRLNKNKSEPSKAVYTKLQKDSSLENSQAFIIRLYSVIDKYSQDLDWKTSSILRLVQCSTGVTKDIMVENLKYILSPQTKIIQDSDTEKELNRVRRKISKLLNNLVSSGVRNPVVLELLVWTKAEFVLQENVQETTDIILGYFGELSSDPVFVSHIITAVLNIKLKTGIILETGYQFLNQQIHSEDKTLRAKARRCVKLMESLDAANNSEVCVDAANLTEDEDINLGKPGILELGTQDGDKMDFTLSFLDELIYKDLCQGGSPYLPSLFRTPEIKPPIEERPLITSYSKLRQDTVGSNRTLSSSSPTPPSATPLQTNRLWTAEGRLPDLPVEGLLSCDARDQSVNKSTDVKLKEEKAIDPLYEGW